jgi:drug/metabolite transporter (DMT)-like permease
VNATSPEITRTDWLIILALAVLWGGAFLFVELALASFPPMTLVLIRLSVAALCLWIWMRVRGERVPGGVRNWWAYSVLGFLNLALPLVLIAWAMTHITAGLSSILNATTPLWGVLVAHVFTHDEKATPARLAGVIFGIAGVAVMIGPSTLEGLGADLLAQIVCIVAALCYALALVYGRRFAERGVAPMQVATGHMIASAVMILPVALITDAPWTLPMPGLIPVAASLALAIFSSVIAYALYFRLLASAGAVAATLPTFLLPIVAILLGIAILGERLETRHWFGMALIGVGLLAIDGRLIPARARGSARSG